MRKRPTIPPGAPLDAVELNRVVPGSRAETNSEGRITGIFEIPLFAIRDADEADHRADSEGIEIEVVFHDEEEAPDSPSPTRAADALRRTPLLSALGPDSMGVLIEDVELVELSGGETLFREGDAGDCLYVVAEGEVAVIAEGPPRQELARLHDGEFFGEVALVTDEPRSATVTAVTATRLLAIDRAAMSALLAEEPHLLDELLGFLRDRMLDRLLHVNPLFRVLDEPQRVVVGARFRFLEIEAGAELIVQGARARGLFILLSGAAEVVRHQGEGQPDRMLGELRAGDLCGELSLLANAPSVAAVRMTRKTLVIELPADAFREVIMTHPQVLAFVADVADERRRRYDAIIAGTETYDSGRVILW